MLIRRPVENGGYDVLVALHRAALATPSKKGAARILTLAYSRPYYKPNRASVLCMVHRLPRKALLAALVVTVLSGCASYRAHTLPASPDLAAALPVLPAPPDLPVLPAVRLSRIDPRSGLTESQVAELAVLADPELKALRAQIGVAQAQALAAGLPPDPLLTLSTAQVLSTGPGLSNPLALSIGEDIGRLITLGDARQAAAEHLRSINYQVLWREWLVAQHARQLWVDIRSVDADALLLRQQIRLYRQALVASGKAAAADALTPLELAPWRSALLHAEVMRADAQRRRSAAQASLRLLLGLAPQAALPLAGRMQRQLPSVQRIANALATLPQRRPDLLALAAGYRSADARLREQILAQFPGVSVQLSRSRDNNGVNMAGLSVGLRLPIFNGNRGNIAIAQASRRALLEQYQARLDSATSEVHALYDALGSIASELRVAEKPLRGLRETAAQAQRAFNAGALDWTTCAGAEQTYLERAFLAISLQRSLAQGRVALQTLLGVTDLAQKMPAKSESEPSS